MSQNPEHSETGLWVLHLFCHLTTDSLDSSMVLDAIKEFESEGDGNEKPNQLICAAVLGHKADVAFMALSKDPWNIKNLQTKISNAGLTISSSYLSITEISEYADGLPEEMKEMRLFPVLPPEDKPVWGFYPMSKSRGEANNWFTLPYDERKRLMLEHGGSGRKFAGRVLQVVTGSTGIDDFEWGVTLFCESPEALKEVVYTLRYDEASAKYGEFGTFYTGIVDEPKNILKSLAGS